MERGKGKYPIEAHGNHESRSTNKISRMAEKSTRTRGEGKEPGRKIDSLGSGSRRSGTRRQDANSLHAKKKALSSDL